MIRTLCDDRLADLLGVESLDFPAWHALIEPVTAQAGLPAGSLDDARV
ncbi:hypothetical protein [Amycolatopsis sp. DG1A-15b]|nr:hypothetical protein [Amycolatopsis sp. DG1A-15b]WIX91391.1 hypothetical protein QRY02_13550 [Amycolatopsis sp. DG1A-15b]